MANNRQKLELTWIGKDIQPKLEPRILLEDTDKSYGDKHSGNRLIHGDNLLALKALEQEFIGKVKCIFIDPPYNTGSAFTHYDDGIEHSLWLTLMRDRLVILRRLLAEDGSIWITIDDNEAHYLKVLCDELFGRKNFVANVVWQKKSSPQANAVWLSDSHDNILIFAKEKNIWRPNLLKRTEQADARFNNPDNDLRGPWMSSDFTISLTGGQRGAAFAKTGISDNIFDITTPSGRIISPTKGRCWGSSKEKFSKLIEDNRIWFGESGNNVPRLKRFLSEVQDGIVATTWWPRTDVGDNQESKREISRFNETAVFSTPKPERLLKRIIDIATNPNDLVLDSFAGSGTTGAVAHKMGRKWIMVELGEHCHTHILPRMQKVCDGTDQGGISKAVNWQGGGGFKYYDLAPSLLKKDRYDQWIINTDYNPTMLAAAMAKHEGFRYRPDENLYWKQGRSSEQDFIFTTTLHITPEHLDSIHDEMQPDEHVLICCKSYFEGAEDRHTRVNIKKIPSMLLGRCEFDRDDYSLHIVDMPRDPDEPDFVPPGPPVIEPKAKPNKADLAGQMNLFTGSES
ncbi:MAG: site-specific DNA-methyltransferase [Candidatus Methylumidiphilus sp.]